MSFHTQPNVLRWPLPMHHHQQVPCSFFGSLCRAIFSSLHCCEGLCQGSCIFRPQPDTVQRGRDVQLRLRHPSTVHLL